MKNANIAEFKNHLSEWIAEVENGEEIQVCRRNIPVALVTPIKEGTGNRTQLGCGEGTAETHGDLTEPLIPKDSWAMLRDNHSTNGSA
jgi:prevent-host-death family protein